MKTACLSFITRHSAFIISLRAYEVDFAFGRGDAAFAFERDREGRVRFARGQAVAHARVAFGVGLECAARHLLVVRDEPELVSLARGRGRQSRREDDCAARRAFVCERRASACALALARELRDARVGRREYVVQLARALELCAHARRLRLRLAQTFVETCDLAAEQGVAVKERDGRYAERRDRDERRRHAERERGPRAKNLPDAEAP